MSHGSLTPPCPTIRREGARSAHLLSHVSMNNFDPGAVFMQGCNPREGVPQMRADWIKEREARGDTVFTQMHYARRGTITQEMAFAAAREGLDPEFVRSEVRKPASTRRKHHLESPNNCGAGIRVGGLSA